MESDFIKSASLKELARDTDEWRSCSTYVSKSSLVRMKVSPAHFRYGEPYVEKPEQEFGKNYHCFVLEPERFKEEFYVFDDSVVCGALIAKGFSKPRSTKDYKTWLEGEEKMIQDKEIVKKEDYDKMCAMKDKLFQHRYARMLLTNGKAEQGVIGALQTTAGEIGVKLITDYRKDKKHIVSELKTTADASKDSFTKDAAKYNYHIQAALYTDMIELLLDDNLPITFIFIAQEKKRPYAFNLFECAPQFIGVGREEYQMLMQMYKYCLDNDTWPGYQIFCENKYGLLELKLPPWAIKPLDFYEHKY